MKLQYACDINLSLREIRVAALELEEQVSLKKQKMTVVEWERIETRWCLAVLTAGDDRNSEEMEESALCLFFFFFKLLIAW